MDDNNVKWNLKEFTLFLLIHASYADLEFTDDEKEAIEMKYDADTFTRIHGEYNDMGDYERIQTIMNYKGLYFPTVAQKNELLDIVLKQFESDGNYSKLEQSLMLFLENLL